MNTAMDMDRDEDMDVDMRAKKWTPLSGSLEDHVVFEHFDENFNEILMTILMENLMTLSF